MGKKRANQPGYKESTDALGRRTWVPVQNNGNKEELINRGHPEDSNILHIHNNFNDIDFSAHQENNSPLSSEMTVSMGGEEWVVEKLDFHSGVLFATMQSPDGQHYQVSNTPWADNPIDVTPVVKESTYRPDVKDVLPIHSIVVSKQDFINYLEDTAKDEEEKQKLEEDLIKENPLFTFLSGYHGDNAKVLREMSNSIKEGNFPQTPFLITEDVDEDSLTLTHWENMDAGNGREYTWSSLVSFGDKEYVIQRKSSSDYNSSIGGEMEKITVNPQGDVEITGGETIYLYEVVGQGAIVNAYREMED